MFGSLEITLAGLPPILQFPSLKDLFTMAPAPIMVLSPISIFPNIFTPGPIQTLFPIIGTDPGSIFCPILTP